MKTPLNPTLEQVTLILTAYKDCFGTFYEIIRAVGPPFRRSG